MLDDFQEMLHRFDLDQVWEDALAADPTMPVVRARKGWRDVQQGVDRLPESWKHSLTTVATTVLVKFSEQLQWRFQKLKKFKWMNLIHPTKFDE